MESHVDTGECAPTADTAKGQTPQLTGEHRRPCIVAVARKKIVDPMHPVFAWPDKPKTSAFLTTVLAGILNPFQRTSDRTLP